MRQDRILQPNLAAAAAAGFLGRETSLPPDALEFILLEMRITRKQLPNDPS